MMPPGPAFLRSARPLTLAGLLVVAFGGAVRADVAVVVHADTVTGPGPVDDAILDRGGCSRDFACRHRQPGSTDPDLRADNRALTDSPEPNGNMMSLPEDVIAFESPRADRTVVLFANWTGKVKTVSTLAGLHGGVADVFVTSAFQDGAGTDARHVSGPCQKPVPTRA